MDEEAQVIVVRGNPDEAELAALVTVLYGASRPATPMPDPSLWTRSGRPGFRLAPGVSGTSGRPTSLPAGAGAWRASGLPH